MKHLTARQQHALEVRDRALIFARMHGGWETLGSVRLLMARADGLTVAYRTPFQKLGGEFEHSSYFRALLGAKGSLPYCIDVWHGSKVLMIEWDDESEFAVSTFKPGLWENKLPELHSST